MFYHAPRFRLRVEKRIQSMHLILRSVNTHQCLFLCWQEQPHCRDSRSTLSGGRGGGGGAYDYLGRPVLYNNSRRGRERTLDRDEENRLRVESYVRNSAMSLVSVPLCIYISWQVKAWFNKIVECFWNSTYLSDDDDDAIKKSVSALIICSRKLVSILLSCHHPSQWYSPLRLLGR